MVESVLNFFIDIWNNFILLIFSSNNIFIDIIDILIVTFIIYKAIQIIRQTRAEQLIKGILVFIIIYVIAQLLNLRTLIWIVSTVYFNAIVVLVVLFQPELRNILERMGRGSFKNIGKMTTDSHQVSLMIDSVSKSCQLMQKEKVGALIVIERTTALGDIIESGTIIDAVPSIDLICNIFFPKSPLHDGAVVIRNGKVFAASCLLPLSENPDIDKILGTRHRSAIGLSERSDALVVVVSEENGIISVASNGKITRNYDMIGLKELLTSELLGTADDMSQAKGIKKMFKRKEVDENEKV